MVPNTAKRHTVGLSKSWIGCRFRDCTLMLLKQCGIISTQLRKGANIQRRALHFAQATWKTIPEGYLNDKEAVKDSVFDLYAVFPCMFAYFSINRSFFF